MRGLGRRWKELFRPDERPGHTRDCDPLELYSTAPWISILSCLILSYQKRWDKARQDKTRQDKIEIQGEVEYNSNGTQSLVWEGASQLGPPTPTRHCPDWQKGHPSICLAPHQATVARAERNALCHGTEGADLAKRAIRMGVYGKIQSMLKKSRDAWLLASSSSVSDRQTWLAKRHAW